MREERRGKGEETGGEKEEETGGEKGEEKGEEKVRRDGGREKREGNVCIHRYPLILHSLPHSFLSYLPRIFLQVAV